MISSIISLLIFAVVCFLLIWGVITFIRLRIRANTDVLKDSEFYLTHLVATQLINPEVLDSTFIAHYREHIDKVYPYLNQKIVNRNLKDIQHFLEFPELAKHYIVTNLLKQTNLEQRAFLVARGIKLSAIYDPSNYFSQQLVIEDSEVNTNFNHLLEVLELTSEQVNHALKRQDL